MNKAYFEKVLNGDVNLIDRLNLEDISLPANEIPVFPSQLRHILIDFLNNKLTADELNRWANFLLLRYEYISPGDPSDYQCMDYYEDMWYVVQRLSTPTFDGEITKEPVKGYLLELQKYRDE